MLIVSNQSFFRKGYTMSETATITPSTDPTADLDIPTGLPEKKTATSGKRGRKTLPEFPGSFKPEVREVKDEKGNVVRETVKVLTKYAPRTLDNGTVIYTPDGYDYDKFSSLEIGNFNSKHDFYMYRAERSAWEVEDFKKKAVDSTLASDSPEANAKKAVKALEKARQIIDNLSKSGFDISSKLSPELLALLGTK